MWSPPSLHLYMLSDRPAISIIRKLKFWEKFSLHWAPVHHLINCHLIRSFVQQIGPLHRVSAWGGAEIQLRSACQTMHLRDSYLPRGGCLLLMGPEVRYGLVEASQQRKHSRYLQSTAHSMIQLEGKIGLKFKSTKFHSYLWMTGQII